MERLAHVNGDPGRQGRHIHGTAFHAPVPAVLELGKAAPGRAIAAAWIKAGEKRRYPEQVVKGGHLLHLVHVEQQAARKSSWISRRRLELTRFGGLFTAIAGQVSS